MKAVKVNYTKLFKNTVLMFSHDEDKYISDGNILILSNLLSNFTRTHSVFKKVSWIDMELSLLEVHTKVPTTDLVEVDMSTFEETVTSDRNKTEICESNDKLYHYQYKYLNYYHSKDDYRKVKSHISIQRKYFEVAQALIKANPNLKFCVHGTEFQRKNYQQHPKPQNNEFFVVDTESGEIVMAIMGTERVKYLPVTDNDMKACKREFLKQNPKLKEVLG